MPRTRNSSCTRPATNRLAPDTMSAYARSIVAIARMPPGRNVTSAAITTRSGLAAMPYLTSVSASAATTNARRRRQQRLEHAAIAREDLERADDEAERRGRPTIASVGLRHSAMPIVISMWPATLATGPKCGGCGEDRAQPRESLRRRHRARFGVAREREHAVDLVERGVNAFLGREVEARRRRRRASRTARSDSATTLTAGRRARARCAAAGPR